MSYSIKKNDTVLVLAGKDKGKIGKVMSVNRKDGRVIVEGVNFIVKHQRATQVKPGERVVKEGAMHISNVMYYAEKIKKPVRLSKKVLEDGSKVRGYIDPTTKEFVQI